MENVLDKCLEDQILTDFIRAHREVIVMRSIWEYDEQAHFEALREDGYDEGYQKGKDSVFQILDRLKNGSTVDTLIAEGLDPEIVHKAAQFL